MCRHTNTGNRYRHHHAQGVRTYMRTCQLVHGCVCVCACVCLHVYMYIYIEREIDRKRDEHKHKYVFLQIYSIFSCICIDAKRVVICTYRCEDMRYSM